MRRRGGAVRIIFGTIAGAVLRLVGLGFRVFGLDTARLGEVALFVALGSCAITAVAPVQGWTRRIALGVAVVIVAFVIVVLLAEGPLPPPAVYVDL